MYFGKSVYEFVQLGVCLVSVDFYHLIPEIIFCGYGSGNYVSVGLVMMCLVFIILIMWDLLLWYSDLCLIIVPCVHGPPSSYCTTTVDLVGRKENYLSLFDLGCLFLSTVWLISSLSHTMGSLLNLSSRSLDGLLNRTVASLVVCNLFLLIKDIYIYISQCAPGAAISLFKMRAN